MRTMMRPTLILLAGVAVPASALADPSDVDKWGNPVGYAEIENAPVTDDNFAYAVLDLAMEEEAKQGAINAFHHHRKPMELDKQPAVLMNRDTLYSFAVVDASQGVTVHVPEGDGRYISTHLMEHDHTTKGVEYGGGDYVIAPGSTTDFLVVNIRTQVNPHDADDVAKANALQDEYRIEFPEGYTPQRFKVTDWNMEELNALKAGYVKLADERGLSNTMGARGDIPLESRNVGAAVATGLLPDDAAWYSFKTYEADKGTCYTATYDVPGMANPALGFYSMTIYGNDLYLHTEDGSSIANDEIVPNPDGKTFDLHFGSKESCPADAQNVLIAPTDDWTLAFRVYFPDAAVQGGKYALPDPEPVS
ncbi:MAG: DUF1254 domain-containing protein [Acuticoccus sp.]